MEYQHFLNNFIEVLNKHAPMKEKYLRSNQGRFITKNLHKAITKRSRLRNKFLRDWTEMSRREYKKITKLLHKSLEKSQKKNILEILA